MSEVFGVVSDAGRRGNWTQTFLGTKVFPLDPRVEDIDIRDIAHQLSLICRYGGATRHHLSVAEHSVHVASQLPLAFRREGLLHDAAEAYIGDMRRPIKHEPEMSFFREVEEKLEAVIFERFGVTSTPESRAAIKSIDNRIIIDEVRCLMSEPPDGCTTRHAGVVALDIHIDGWPARFAEEVFLDIFCDLFPEHAKGIRP